ncbi:MAG TPA: Rieske (2Fe-2S) protein [Gemmataceae bacterium]|nr:Rieske (2Fe-2S) protein [Gemmataceae bacterium]
MKGEGYGMSGEQSTGSDSSFPLHPPSFRKALPSIDLGPGALTKVIVAGKPVLLARLEDGTVAAASAVCPHRGEDLSGGHIYMGAIDCPHHHYLYDLRTGVNRYPRDVFPADLAAGVAPLPLYAVKEEGGWIWIGLKDEGFGSMRDSEG